MLASWLAPVVPAIFCTFEFSGPTFDADVFLAARPELRPATVWRRGETLCRGGVQERSGFVLEVAEGDAWGVLLERVLESATRMAPVFDAAREAGATVALDIGIVVPEPGHFTRTVHFAPEVLQQLAELGVRLSVAAYPLGGE